MYTTYTTALRQTLIDQSDPKTKAWWQGYVKQSAPFLGVKMADIRSSVHQWYRGTVATDLDLEQQVDLALVLFQGEYSEEKLAGTLYLQEILLPAGAVVCERDIDRFAGLFINGYIHDWNICDWFCVKVLGPFIELEGNGCATTISIWRSVENLWQARASLVAFVPVAENQAYYPLIERSCQVIIKREERFAKTAVGWILREISKHDQGFVAEFVNGNINCFTSESLGNAIKYFSTEEKKAFRKMLREAR
jgi:3-methyladenine DNA glycosylase AlkD